MVQSKSGVSSSSNLDFYPNELHTVLLGVDTVIEPIDQYYLPLLPPPFAPLSNVWMHALSVSFCRYSNRLYDNKQTGIGSNSVSGLAIATFFCCNIFADANGNVVLSGLQIDPHWPGEYTLVCTIDVGLLFLFLFPSSFLVLLVGCRSTTAHPIVGAQPSRETGPRPSLDSLWTRGRVLHRSNIFHFFLDVQGCVAALPVPFSHLTASGTGARVRLATFGQSS